MKRLLFTILLLLSSITIASAQCNGIFPNNTVCGNASGASNTPRPTSPAGFQGSAGGTNGQIQYNNSGALGGFTAGQDCTVNTATGAFNCTRTANTPFAPSATTDTTNAANITSGTLTPPRFTDTTLQANGKSLYYNSGTGKLQYYWYSPVGPTFDLRDCMDVHYGVGSWVEYGPGAGSGTDIGPAIQTCINTLVTNFGRGTLFIPPGVWALNTANTNFSGIVVQGVGSQASVIVYEPTANIAFFWSGCVTSCTGETSGGGIRGIGISLDSGHGSTTAVPIQLQGACPSFCYEPDQWELDDVYITAVGASSFWGNGPLLDGTARTSPQGIRVGSINNLQIFNCVNWGITLKGVVQWTLTNLGTYTGFGSPGTLSGMDVVITGGGASNTNSTLVTINGLESNGNLQINNASRVWVQGTAQQFLGASSATLVSGNLQISGNLSSATPVGFPSNIHVLDHDAPPSVGACGTSPSTPTGGDYDGQVVEGTSTTSCQITFTKPFNATPRCVVNAQGAFPSSLAISSLSATQITWTHGSGQNTMVWHCSGF